MSEAEGLCKNDSTKLYDSEKNCYLCIGIVIAIEI